MDLKTLQNTPPWEWPADAGEVLLQILRDDQADATDRAIAAELAGDLVVMNDDLAAALLAIVESAGEAEDVRCSAAIALGPALEQADVEGFDDPDPDDVPISEQTFRMIQELFRRLYTDASVPKHVRRRILEAAVRAPQEWHADATRTAYNSGDEDWRLTAVFAMQYVQGFEDEILEALEDANPDIYYEAVRAAGSSAIKEAWPHIKALVTSNKTEKELLLAAIEAVASIRPNEVDILVDLEDSEDEDIAEAAAEAMVMARVYADLEEEDDDDDEWDR